MFLDVMFVVKKAFFATKIIEFVKACAATSYPLRLNTPTIMGKSSYNSHGQRLPFTYVKPFHQFK